MSVIYVREQGSVLAKRGGRLLVEKDDKPLLEIPLRDADSIALFGNVLVTTQALSVLLERSIPLTFFTQNGRLKGHLSPESSRNVPLRLAQYRASQDEARSLELAKAVVRAKLRNSARLVADYRAHYPSDELARAAESLDDAAGRVDAAATHSELMGHEGAAAAAYFRAFAAINRSGIPFEGRRMHPSPDPVNALLSLGYTMAMNEIRGAAEARGLEPHIGFLHQIDYGRPSLALDLVEPFRSVAVDRLTLRLLNERVFTAADFAKRLGGPGAGGVVLTPEAFKRFLIEYEAALTGERRAAPDGYRAAFRKDVEALARALSEGGPFQPYTEDEPCEEAGKGQPCST